MGVVAAAADDRRHGFTNQVASHRCCLGAKVDDMGTSSGVSDAMCHARESSLDERQQYARLELWGEDWR